MVFICTGNYFRSKFAEIYFNYVSNRLKLDWVAISRGIDISNPNNVGCISQNAINQLNYLGIPLPNDISPPTLLTNFDFVNAGCLIAVNHTEHFSAISSNYNFEDAALLYWDIKDIQEENPTLSLNKLKAKIDDLITTLQS